MPRPPFGDRYRDAACDVLVAVALLVLAWMVYDPTRPRPVDYVDFPENIRALRTEAGFVDQFRALTDAYKVHGRWNPISFALIAAQWNAFGTDTLAWQLTRYCIMAAVLVLGYGVFRRLRLNRPGSFFATLFLVASPPAVAGWTRLTTAEPVALLFLLVACHVALAESGRLRAWALAGLLLLVMWTKEAITPAFAFPLLLAITPAQGFRALRLNRPVVVTLFPCVLAFAVGAVPIIQTYLGSPPASFAAQYGSGQITKLDLVASALAAVLPFAPEAYALELLVVFLLLVIVGWHLALTASAGTERAVLLLTCALVLPVLGALTYAPWHFYTLIYALPFMAAGALLAGQAVSVLTSSHTAFRVAASVCTAVLSTFALMQARNSAERLDAVRFAFVAAVNHVATVSDVDSVLVAVAPAQLTGKGSMGPLLSAYASMQGHPWPGTRDLTCADALVPQHNAIALTFSVMCPLPATSDTMIVFRYSRYDWPSVRARSDSVGVAIGRMP